MADELMFEPVLLGVGESAVARAVVQRPLRVERFRVLMVTSRLASFLHSDNLDAIEVVSVKIGGAEQLSATIHGASFSSPKTSSVSLPFTGKIARPGDTIAVTVRDRGRAERTVRRACRRLLMHRQPVVVIVDVAQVQDVRPVLIGLTATPMRSDGQRLSGIFGSRRTPGRS
jgi:hypothetical protein